MIATLLIPSMKFAVILLLLAGSAHAQVLVCDSAAQGQLCAR